MELSAVRLPESDGMTCQSTLPPVQHSCGGSYSASASHSSVGEPEMLPPSKGCA